MQEQTNQNIVDHNYLETNESNEKVLLTNKENNVKIFSKRGRKSTVPPEIREQTRRIKKQNIERSRRACIATKMTELHRLAMSLIGLDVSDQRKTEKVDILGICYEVFENVSILLNERPELKEKLKQMCHAIGNKSFIKRQELIDNHNNDCITSKLDHLDTYSNKSQLSIICEKENYDPSSENFLIPSELSAFTPIQKIQHPNKNHLEYHSTPIQLLLPTTDSGYFELYSSSSTIDDMNAINLQTINKYDISYECQSQDNYVYSPQTFPYSNSIITSLKSKENISLTNQISVNTSNNSKDVWRPYLD
ncbi:unnamed protein product [Heterobilharzia americana]|nr:unnamed protein product [Heterobilharzia americana]